MTDKKISALTSATPPLAGTEAIPLVQSGATVSTTVSGLQVAPVSTGTADGVQYLNGSKVPTTGTALTFDGTNLGLGTASYPWNVTKALQLSASGAVYGDGVSYDFTTGISQGVYRSGISSWTRTGGVPVSRFELDQDTFSWYSAPAGTASTVVSPFTKVMGLDASGNLTNTTGNFVQGTAAKGVNFTANTPAAGMTSQLLNWYEEGDWTPVMTAFSGTITTVGSVKGTYVKIGRSVTLSIDAAITTNGTANTLILITGMPFSGSTATVGFYSGCGVSRSTGATLSVEYQPAVPRIVVSTYSGAYPGSDGARFIISVTYQV